MIAGTATAVSGRVAQHQHKKFAQNHQPQQIAMAPPPDMGHVGGTDMVGQLQQLADLRAAGVVTTQKLVAEHSVIMDPAYVHITRDSLAETARLRGELAAAGVHSIGRYGGWTYCSIEDNIVEARALVASFQ